MKSIFIFLFVSILFISCDKVDGPFRENAESGGTVDTSGTASDGFTRFRKVLVEDYTGHKCGNCPEAGNAANNLNTLFGKKAVVVAIHAGFFATPSATGMYSYNFTTPVGNNLDNFFAISKAGNPNGMVNRKGHPNNKHIIPYSAWDDSVQSISKNAPNALLKISNSYNETNNTVSTTVNSKFLSNLTGEYKLSVYLVEDSIINWQKDYSKSPSDNPNYAHRHVFRGAFNNSAWGETVVSGAITDTNKVYTKSYNLVLGTDWKPKKAYVVAFIYNSTTYEILQVEERKVLE